MGRNEEEVAKEIQHLPGFWGTFVQIAHEEETWGSNGLESPG